MTKLVLSVLNPDMNPSPFPWNISSFTTGQDTTDKVSQTAEWLSSDPKTGDSGCAHFIIQSINSNLDGGYGSQNWGFDQWSQQNRPGWGIPLQNRGPNTYVIKQQIWPILISYGVPGEYIHIGWDFSIRWLSKSTYGLMNVGPYSASGLELMIHLRAIGVFNDDIGSISFGTPKGTGTPYDVYFCSYVIDQQQVPQLYNTTFDISNVVLAALNGPNGAWGLPYDDGYFTGGMFGVELGGGAKAELYTDYASLIFTNGYVSNGIAGGGGGGRIYQI